MKKDEATVIYLVPVLFFNFSDPFLPTEENKAMI